MECPECGGPPTYEYGTTRPCERCEREWAWLGEQQTPGLMIAWERAQQRLYEIAPYSETVIGRLRIVSFENRVVALAGFKVTRRWAERRYPEIIRVVVGSEKRPVFLSPRPGATIARRIQREKEE